MGLHMEDAASRRPRASNTSNNNQGEATMSFGTQVISIPSTQRRLLATALATLAPFVAHATEDASPAAPDDAADKGKNLAELDTVSVEGQNAEEPASPKFTAPLLDTPRSVTVIPQSVIQDTNSTTLLDALRTVPGITFGAGEATETRLASTAEEIFLARYDANGKLLWAKRAINAPL